MDGTIWVTQNTLTHQHTMNLLTLTLLALVSTPSFAVISPSAKEHLLKRKLIQQELPQTPGEEWTSLENGVEFLPAADLSPLAQQHLRKLTGGAYAAAGVYEQAMIDGTETYYDGKTAWVLALLCEIPH